DSPRLAADRQKVSKTTAAAAPSGRLAQPPRTATSQSAATTTGSTKPSAGRSQRAKLPLAAGCSAAAGSTVTAMATADINGLSIAMPFQGSRPSNRSIAGGHVMIVDEVIDRLFDIDRRADHPRLL